METDETVKIYLHFPVLKKKDLVKLVGPLQYPENHGHGTLYNILLSKRYPGTNPDNLLEDIPVTFRFHSNKLAGI